MGCYPDLSNHLFGNKSNSAMKKSCLLSVLAAVSLLTGCATHPVGRYVTIVNDSGSVIMTDTTTGQVWITAYKTPGVLADESFTKPKAQ
jgi:uncharacterized lipoprotein YajG